MHKTLTTLPVLCALVAFAASAQQPTLQSLCAMLGKDH